MASSALKTEIMLFLVLLPTVLVSGQIPTTASGTTANPTTATSMTAAMAGTTGASSSPGGSTAASATSMMTAGSAGASTSMSSGASASMSSGASASMSSGASASMSSGASASMSSGASASMSSGASASMSSGASASMSSQTQMMTTQALYQNTTNSSNGTMISCPSFTCNYSDCNMMYTSQNQTTCADGYCQLLQLMNMCYTVSCTASCAETCTNSSQTNCSMNCCNTTNCLNETFASMIMTTTLTMAAPETQAATTSMVTMGPQTAADKRNECHGETCVGSTCYTNFQTVQKCASTETHCQLKKKTTNNAGVEWTARCTTNCSTETACESSTLPPCQLECCTATMSSCLFLNGTLNVPSFAPRGLYVRVELIASSLLFAISLLL